MLKPTHWIPAPLWRKALALLLLLCVHSAVLAQVPDPEEGEVEEEYVEPQSGPPSGLIVGGLSPTDTTGDSTKKPIKVVRIRTLRIDPYRFTRLLAAHEPVSFDPGLVMEPDLLWRQEGWHNSLGQIGKPYRRYRYGVESAFFREQGVFINPITLAEDVYLLHPEQGHAFFDTRTPYVNIYYGQGKSSLAQLRVDVSHNINPFINVSALYYRRNSAGVYKGFSTSHDNLGLNASAHTPNNRYHAFFGTLFHESDEELNGGVEQGFAYEDLFNKSVQPVALEETRLRRYMRAVHFLHTITLLGARSPAADTTALDSGTAPKPPRQSLRLFNTLTHDNFSNEYTDSGLDSTVNDVQFPVYPTLEDSTFFYERYLWSRLKADFGGAYRLNLGSFETGHRLEFSNERITFEKNLYDRALIRFSTLWHGDMRITTKPFEILADARFINTLSNRYNTETLLELGGSLGLPGQKVDYQTKEPGPILRELDSVLVDHGRRPFRIELRSIVHSRNPSIQQTYGAGWAGNTFLPDSSITNTRLEHLRIGAVYQGRSRLERLTPVTGTEVGITGFVSRMVHPTYFDQDMRVQQARGDNLQFLGVEGRFRVRAGSFFFENRSTYQLSTSSAGLDTLLAEMQPSFYGKAGIYYQSRKLRVATGLRIGLDYYYHLSYFAPLFDAPSQAFYPQREFLQPGYHRVDAYFTVQIKRAHVFFKMAHANEGLLAPGYFTTLMYPMLDRTFMVGMNWTFFD